MDSYIADLKAATQMELDLKLFRMKSLGIPQERISERLDTPLKTIYNHISAKLAILPKWPISDLKKGFTVSQVAEKHGWPESLVWSIALDGKNDLGRFRDLQWGLRTWDLWNWNDCDKRFGDEWPGRIPAQLVAHILYYFSKKGTRLVMINADWRDFQSTPALEENEESAILIIDYGNLMRKAGG